LCEKTLKKYKSMFHKLLPFLLLFTGCLDAPFDTQIASTTAADKKAAPTDNQTDSVKIVARPDRLVSIFRSNDQGRSWTPNGEGLPENLFVTQLDTLGKQIVLATSNYGFYLSDPQKQSWQQLDTTHLPSLKITTMHVEKGVIYAGMHQKGIFASHDLGKTWDSLNHNLEDESVKSILRAGNELWIATDQGIFALPDGSKVWQQIFDKPHSSGLLKVGENYLAGTYDGIILSSDKGRTWGLVFESFNPSRLFVLDGKIIALQNDKAAQLSADMGKTWTPMRKDFGDGRHVLTVAKLGNHLMSCRNDGIFQSTGWDGEWKPIYRFSYNEPYGALLNWGEQWNEVYSRPEAPFTDLIIVDGVVYGGTVRGC
jgi:photosystem II stability/assembly factor-like uncharacterized protein